MKPSPRTEARLLRDAIRTYAQANGKDFLDAEADYNHARSSLAHLWAHEVYAAKGGSSVAQVRDLLDGIVSGTREMLRDSAIDQAWAAKVKSAVDKIESLGTKLFHGRTDLNRLTPAQVQALLEIVQVHKDLIHTEGYDPSGVIDPTMLTLAQMVAQNFQAYDATINH